MLPYLSLLSYISFALLGTSQAASLPSQDLRTRSIIGRYQTDIYYGVCKPLTIIFARGSNAADNYGEDGIGTSLAEELVRRITGDKLALQGIEKYYYPASNISDSYRFPQETKSGGERAIAFAQALKSFCPTTQLVLAGYSQGAMVMHQAGNSPSLDANLANWIHKVVIFGDCTSSFPGMPTTFGALPVEKIKSWCRPGDQWCDPNYQQMSDQVKAQAHYSYGYDSTATEAADYILQGVII